MRRLLVILSAASALAGCGASSTPRQQADAYIKQVHINAAQVQASVEVVFIDIGLHSRANQIAQDAQAAHDRIDAIRDNFATTGGSGGLGDAETEVWVAAGDLRDAMHNLVTYAGTPNPATLVRFKSLFQQARAEWNQSVGTIWRTANTRHAPTI